MRRAVFLALALVASVLTGCGRGKDADSTGSTGPIPSQRGASAAGAVPEDRPASRSAAGSGPAATGVGVSAGAEAPLVVFLGDSLTAGLGLPVDQAFPAVVAAVLAKKGLRIRAVNAGVSGDTTAGGLRRADWVLSQRPDVVVLELGANDGLRGLPLEQTEGNLRGIVEKARAAGARVLLCGMLLPTSYGPEYRDGFAGLFPRIAREEGLPLVPFLLQGVAGRADLNLEDGIHPNPEGQKIVAANVLPALEALLDARSSKTRRDR